MFFLQAVVGLLLGQISEATRSLEGDLAGLKDLVATDSTVVRLHDFLARSFRGSRTNHSKAALKLHVVMSVLGGGAHSVRVTSERANDGKTLKVGPWVRGRLLLFDLAYYHYRLFARIEHHGGCFLSRAKRHINPLILGVDQAPRGRGAPLVGEKLQDVLARLKGGVLDLEVRARFRRPKRGAKSSVAYHCLRLVGLWSEERQAYDLYVTNLLPDRLPAGDVARLYRARWSVELLFKALKSDYGLAEMPSAKKETVQALVYATIVTWLASRELLLAVRRRMGKKGRRVTDGRWSRLMREWSFLMLVVITAPPRHGRQLASTVEFALLHECLDPHLSRPSLLEQVENRTRANSGAWPVPWERAA